MKCNEALFLKDLSRRSITAFGLIILVSFIYVYAPASWFTGFIFIIALYAIVYEWIPYVYRLGRNHVWQRRFIILTPWYPCLPFAFLILLSKTPAGKQLFIPLIIIVASHDTASYIVGKLIGQTKCFPSISPYKSWEGAIAGLIATISCVIALNRIAGHATHIVVLMCIGSVLTMVTFFGDLFESWIKRKLDIKDFSALLPGHGGVLDRCDSILITGSVFLIFQNYFITIF